MNTTRWSQALDLENRNGFAVGDSDPIKLHYSWSLARLGATSASRFAQELAFVRKAMLQQQLGFADAVLAKVPDEATLRRQKAGDPCQPRRSFELHLELSEPLTERYQCLERIFPDHIVWELPEDGLDSIRGISSHIDRYGVRALNASLRELPKLN